MEQALACASCLLLSVPFAVTAVLLPNSVACARTLSELETGGVHILFWSSERSGHYFEGDGANQEKDPSPWLCDSGPPCELDAHIRNGLLADIAASNPPSL